MQGLTRISLKRPGLAIGVLLVITAGFAAGLPHLRTEFGSRVLIGDDHPAIRTLDAFLERFGGGVPLYIAWACGPDRPCESVFDDASLRMAHAVSSALERHPGVSKVRSPANAPVFVPVEGGFSIRYFVERDEINGDRDALARRASTDPIWVGNLISEDARVGAIIVQTLASNSSTDEAVVEAVLAAIAPFEEFDFALVGEAFGNIIGGRELAESTADLIPIMVLVIGLVIFAQTRSWQSVASSLLTLGVALLWTFGALAWVGWPRDSILEILAPLILIVGVCDSIHFFSVYAEDPASEGSRTHRRGALERAAAVVSAPCVLTTATTGVAFLSFATSNLDTFERFGTTAAFGVAACLVLTFSLLPILLWALPAHSAQVARLSHVWRSILESTTRTAESRAVPILVASLILVIASSLSWKALLRVDTSRQELFGENSRILTWVRFFEDNLRPSFGIEFDLGLPPATTIEDPETLRVISQFSTAMEEEPGVGDARSVIQVLERVNDLMTESAVEGQGFSTYAANAELLEVVELEDPDLLLTWLSFDRRHVRISVDVLEQNYASAEYLVRTASSLVAEEIPSDWHVEMTGTLPLGFDWVSDVHQTQLRSFPTAFVLVFILVALFLRSPTLGLAALVPATVPVVVVLGAMGIAGLSLDVGRAMIAAVVIGIAVDDSIHLLHRYTRLRSLRKNPGEAMSAALLETGRPIIVTSIALALGFMTLTASAWGTVSGFGFFVSLSILVALVATLFILPALVFVASKRLSRA